MEDKELKYFANNDGAGNFDDADFIIGANEWVNMENCRTGSTDKGVTGTVESIGGTLRISAVQPSVTFLEIGSAEEIERNRFCYFKYNTTGTNHKIVCYEALSNTEYDVLLSSQVTGGLNFSKDSIIHSARVINGKLYWVDGTNNQPRKINIDAAIKGNYPSYVTDEEPYSYPINFSEITLIKPPPPLSPNIQKLTDGAFSNNFIATDSFMFAYEYIWYDDEITVLGTYSPASRLNKPSDTANYIAVTMDSNEQVPDTVKIVRLVVRFGNSNNAIVINTWDKSVAAEAAEIVAQNNGSQVLTYNFYNNETGETIPTNDVLKPFDNVPKYSQSLEAATERIFLANNTFGYATPLTTSLEVAMQLSTISGTTLSKTAWGVRLSWATPDKGYAAWYVYLTEVVPVGWYELTSTVSTNSSQIPPAPSYPPPGSIAFSGLTYKGSSQSDVIDTIRIAQGAAGATIVNDFSSYSNTITITGVSITTYDIFKSGSKYNCGVVFYDFAMRKCGVVINGSVISTGNRNYAFSTGVTSAVWSLDNSNAINEIPDWAYYYTPVRTLNLKTRNFIQSFTNAAKYVTKDANGVYQFTNNTFVTGTIGIGINTAALNQSGLGYTFNEKDICILTKSDNTQRTLPVIGQYGTYIIVQPTSAFGDLSTAKFVYEVYTPHETSDQEPYFEVGQMYRVLNPTTSIRAYETLSDIFLPDSYLVSRNYSTETYFSEAMSPNDNYWATWFNDSGKLNLITKKGESTKEDSIVFSNTFIPETAVNGLSTFDVLNEKNLPIQMGALRKLQLTSKVQDELGVVMLAIGEKQTASVYIGEVQQYGSNQSTNLVVSDQVLGTVNVLKGNFGTVNPEGVVEFRGTVWIPDANNKVWVQYASNGLFPISEYKMMRFWNLFFTQFQSMTAAEIEALGGRPFIFATVDPYHKELLISIPKLLSTPPKGYLPDYPSTVYPFDIWDGLGKTIVYKLGDTGNKPRWHGGYSFNPEGFVTLLNKLYSFRQGSLYVHNQPTNQNEFYGTQYKSRVMFVSNKNPTIPKIYNNFNVQSNIVPTFVYFYNDYPYQQSSDLVDYSFNQLEGIWYSTLLRNKLVPTATGFTTDGLLTGEKMRNVAMKILVEFSPTTTQLDLKFAEIGFIISKGNN